MENSLLEIELVHYVVILMWIPLTLQVEKTTPDWIKNLTHVGFLAWLFYCIANLIQDCNNVLYMYDM